MNSFTRTQRKNENIVILSLSNKDSRRTSADPFSTLSPCPLWSSSVPSVLNPMLFFNSFLLATRHSLALSGADGPLATP